MFKHMCSVCPGARGVFKSASTAVNLLANQLPPQAQNLGTYFGFSINFHKTVFEICTAENIQPDSVLLAEGVYSNTQNSCTVQLKHTILVCVFICVSEHCFYRYFLCTCSPLICFLLCTSSSKIFSRVVQQPDVITCPRCTKGIRHPSPFVPVSLLQPPFTVHSF